MSLDEVDQLGIAVFRIRVCADGTVPYDWWNAVAARLMDRPAAAIRGLDAREIFGGRFGRRAWDHHRRVAETGEGLTYRLTLPLPDGEREFQTVLNPVLEDGRVAWIWGSSTDVTGEQQARSADILRRTALEESEQFITMAAHDLRTPMRNIGIVVEELREGFEDLGDGKSELFDDLERIADRASRLIGDVLVHARAAAAARRGFETFSLAELCADIFGVLDPNGRADLAADDAWLTAERPTVQIILRNLVDNAMKHAGARALRLRIAVAPAEGMLRFDVHDNGSGFDDPTLAFLDGGEFRYDSGFGLLGLRRLIEARGGTLGAANAAAGGSVVTIRFPGALAPPPEASAPSPAART